MKRTVKILLIGLLSGLGWGAAAHAEEPRYISIRNTDSAWIQGQCSLVFRLDNGGSGEFNALSITLQLKDKAGHTLGEGTLGVAPFGDSDATRSVEAATEFDCDAVEKARTITISAASELRGGNKQVKLPLSTFDPQYYQPLKIAVSKP